MQSEGLLYWSESILSAALHEAFEMPKDWACEVNSKTQRVDAAVEVVGKGVVVFGGVLWIIGVITLTLHGGGSVFVDVVALAFNKRVVVDGGEMVA